MPVVRSCQPPHLYKTGVRFAAKEGGAKGRSLLIHFLSGKLFLGMIIFLPRIGNLAANLPRLSFGAAFGTICAGGTHGTCED